MRRILTSRHFVATILAMATGMVIFYSRPFPEDQLFLRVIATRAPHALLSFRCLYNVALFTTPYSGYLGVLSGLYIGTLAGFPSSCVAAGHASLHIRNRTSETTYSSSWEKYTTRVDQAHRKIPVGWSSRSADCSPASQSWALWEVEKLLAACTPIPSKS